MRAEVEAQGSGGGSWARRVAEAIADGRWTDAGRDARKGLAHYAQLEALSAQDAGFVRRVQEWRGEMEAMVRRVEAREGATKVFPEDAAIWREFDLRDAVGHEDSQGLAPPPTPRRPPPCPSEVFGL